MSRSKPGIIVCLLIPFVLTGCTDPVDIVPTRTAPPSVAPVESGPEPLAEPALQADELFRLSILDGVSTAAANAGSIAVPGLRLLAACTSPPGERSATITVTVLSAARNELDLDVYCDGNEHIGRIGADAPFAPPFELRLIDSSAVPTGYAVLVADDGDGL
jgi:hypothetical protein